MNGHRQLHMVLVVVDSKSNPMSPDLQEHSTLPRPVERHPQVKRVPLHSACSYRVRSPGR